jgi:ferrous iron transport protein A
MVYVSGEAAKEPGLIPLADLEPGARARIVRISGGLDMRRRCLALGLRPGAEISISQSRRHGVVVGADNTRVALGEGMAGRLLVERMNGEER